MRKRGRGLAVVLLTLCMGTEALASPSVSDGTVDMDGTRGRMIDGADEGIAAMMETEVNEGVITETKISEDVITETVETEKKEKKTASKKTVKPKMVKPDASQEALAEQRGAQEEAQKKSAASEVRIQVKDYREDLREHPKPVRSVAKQAEIAGQNAYVADVFREAYREDMNQLELKVYSAKAEHLEEEDGRELLEELRFLTEMMSVFFEEEMTDRGQLMELTFTVNNITERMEVYILSYCEEHGWELLETEVDDENQVTARFHAPASLLTFVYTESEEVRLPEEGVGTAPQTGLDDDTF